MPVWPKSIYTFGRNLQTAATEWRLRQKRSAAAAQQRIFGELTTRLAATSYWREAGLTAGTSYDNFQARVAPRTYEQIAPAIERMKRGEADVLWPGPSMFFVRTAGTCGPARMLPVTDDMLAHFAQAERDALLYYTVRVRHAAVFRGRHLFLSGSTALRPIAEAKPHAAYVGGLGGIAALNRPTWAERHLYEPGETIGQMGDWDAKVAAIVKRARGLDITMLAGAPNWSLALATALRDSSIEGKRRLSSLQGLWPNLECLLHGGLPIGPFADELRAVLGPSVTFHEVYAAAEGVIAAQDIESGLGLRLMAAAGIFYEFVPLTEFDDSRVDQLGRKAVPLVGVKTGVDYVPLLTTPAGLCRHVLGDIVRFTSTEPPRLICVGRTALRLHALGEQVIEKELTDALVAICRRKEWCIVNFHVAPLVANSLTGQHRGRHEWWVELRPGTKATPTGPQMAADLDTELQRVNADYAARRRNGVLDAPAVRLVMPGVFEHWLRYQQKWGSPHQMPRSRPDRFIADQLAQITSFSRD